jgi:hypothetical protein
MKQSFQNTFSIPARLEEYIDGKWITQRTIAPSETVEMDLSLLQRISIDQPQTTATFNLSQFKATDGSISNGWITPGYLTEGS